MSGPHYSSANGSLNIETDLNHKQYKCSEFDGSERFNIGFYLISASDSEGSST